MSPFPTLLHLFEFRRNTGIKLNTSTFAKLRPLNDRSKNEKYVDWTLDYLLLLSEKMFYLIRDTISLGK